MKCYNKLFPNSIYEFEYLDNRTIQVSINNVKMNISRMKFNEIFNIIENDENK